MDVPVSGEMTRARSPRLAMAALVAVLGALLARPAVAQEHRWEIGVFGGEYFGSRIFLGDELKILISSAPTYGVRVGYAFSPPLALEAAWAHSASHLEAQDPATGEIIAPEADIDVDTYELDLLYNFGKGFARGYFGVGAGVMSLDPDIPGAEGSTKFEGTFLAGAKFFLTERLALRVDGRYRWRATERTRTGTVVCLEEFGCHGYTTNLYSSGEITGGLSFGF